MTLQSLKHWLLRVLQKKIANSWCNWLWPSPMQFSNHWMMDLPNPDLSPRPRVCEWPILAHSCLLLCLCKGLPKAAMINHQRLWYGTGFVTAIGVKGDDVIYTTLPLYHSAAMMIGVHGCILTGKLFLSKGTGVQYTFICAPGESNTNCGYFLSARNSI